MPIVLQNIEAKVLDNFIGDVNIFNSIEASIQFEDYIKLNGFVAFLQNFTQVSSVEYLEKPLTFGLINQYSLEMQTLDISYVNQSVTNSLVFGLDWTTTVDNPCDANPWLISNDNKTIRYNITDSSDCGGTCSDTQAGTATANITVGDTPVFMDLTFVGIGELEDPNYEKIAFYLDGNLVASADAAGGGLGCTFGPVNKIYAVPSPYYLAPNTQHTLFIDFTTNDEFYHVGCYYEINLNFITN